jgi:hypothetical protein
VGVVFAALAIFDMGCTSGACYAPPINRKTNQQASSSSNEITYEEVGN